MALDMWQYALTGAIRVDAGQMLNDV